MPQVRFTPKSTVRFTPKQEGDQPAESPKPSRLGLYGNTDRPDDALRSLTVGASPSEIVDRLKGVLRSGGRTGMGAVQWGQHLTGSDVSPTPMWLEPSDEPNQALGEKIGLGAQYLLPTTMAGPSMAAQTAVGAFTGGAAGATQEDPYTATVLGGAAPAATAKLVQAAKNLPSRLISGAGSIRAAVESGGASRIPTSKTDALVQSLKAIVRPVAKGTARTMEGAARTLSVGDKPPVFPDIANKFQGEPTPLPPTPPQRAVGMDAVTDIRGQRIPAQPGGSAVPARMPENAPPVMPAREGPPLRQAQPIGAERPQTPSFIDDQLAGGRAAETPEQLYQRQQQMRDTDSFERGPFPGEQIPEVAPQYPQPQPQPQLTSTAQEPFEAIEQRMGPSGAESKLGAERIAPELAKTHPELLATPKGPLWDAKLFEGFQKAEHGVEGAQQAVPHGTTVFNEPVADGFAKVIDKYRDIGADDAVRVLAREWEKVADKGPQIPWDEYMAYKRRFGDQMRLMGTMKEAGTAADKASAKAMGEAYKVLMDAGAITPELRTANHEYWLMHSAMDDAGVSFNTGRKIANIGKVPTPEDAELYRKARIALDEFQKGRQ